MNKNEVLKKLESMAGSNYTPVYLRDRNGNNGAYVRHCVDDFFDSDSDCCLESPEWVLLGCKKAKPEDTDMEIWAQEFIPEDIQDLQELLYSGRLYIASFCNDEGYMDVMVWK